MPETVLFILYRICPGEVILKDMGEIYKQQPTMSYNNLCSQK